MKKSLRSLCAVTTISLCAMGNLFAVDNNYFNSVYMIDQKHIPYLQPIITQYFIDNKSEIWLLFLIAHSKR